MRLSSHNMNLLRDRVLILGGSAETAIARAVHALIERDSTLAEAVIAEDDEIDKLENEIDQQCNETLLTGNYSNGDLRFVLAVSRAAPIIERIADHAVNIAKHALVLIDKPQLKPYIDLPQMASIAQEMLLDGLDALTRANCELARRTIKQDDRVDAFHHRIYHELIDMMERDPKTVRRAVELLFVIKHLERIADYATNICEVVVYMAEGRVIRHTQEAQ
ncbi:MAG: phosphate signaling complex protein PhoU [Blastocatellia bacterium]|nr:phosphate signaling complex protein PhoU [Blastocatellia bacterium]